MTIISLVLFAFFSFASSIKLTGWQKTIFQIQLGFFKNYGLNRTHMFLIGLIESASALCLLLSVLIDNSLLNALGATGILFTSIGAIFFHLRFDTLKDAIPAIVTLSLSGALLFCNEYVYHALLVLFEKLIY
ncbi:DoxX family protein [Pseudoalteromonas phenolica]|uniref:DoxX family protein n=1 Tax=Pseudoalteromonas phenolica TaxID=161398 RepID=UPI00384ACB14